jgi:acyl carrier protein
MSQWTEATLLDAIRKIVRDSFGIDLSDKPATMPIAELGLDSMGVIDVVMSVEDVIGRRIENIDLPKNPTLEDVVAMVIRTLYAADANGQA